MHLNVLERVTPPRDDGNTFESNRYPADAATKHTSTPMLSSLIGFIVGVCLRCRHAIIFLFLAMAAASSIYAVKHFAINTDINKLISPTLEWRKNELNF